MVLNNLGDVLHQQGEDDRASVVLDECVQLSRALGYKQILATALDNLADIARQRREYARARTLCAEGLAPLGEVEDTWSVAALQTTLGLTACDEGNFAEAERLHRDSLSLRRTVQDQHGIAQSLENLAQVTRAMGARESAHVLYEEAVDIYLALPDYMGAIKCMLGLASVALASKRSLIAAHLCLAVAALCQTKGIVLPPLTQVDYQRTLAGVWAQAREELPECYEKAFLVVQELFLVQVAPPPTPWRKGNSLRACPGRLMGLLAMAEELLAQALPTESVSASGCFI